MHFCRDCCICSSRSSQLLSRNFRVRVFGFIIYALVSWITMPLTLNNFFGTLWNTRNDLWALGCTLYQMLSGTSPFKDASEWLIFQRIIARDIKFPNYLSEAAKDLIDRLLVRYIKNRRHQSNDMAVTL